MTFAVSCIEERMPADVQPADVPCVLKTSRSAFSFNAKMATIKFDIKSQNVSWELTGAPSWLTISPKSGSGDATVTLTAAENKDVDNNRVAVLQLKSTTSKYEFSKSITVTQNAAEVFLNTSESSLTLVPQAVQKEISVSSNVEWEAISSASWLTVTKPTTTTLSLNASENTTAGTRKATVTLRRMGTTRALATISVVQSEAGITGSTETVAFTVDGGTKSIDIEADVAWSATTSEASWLTVTPTNGTGGKASLGITALANNSTAARSGYVYVNIGTTQKLAIPVSQEGISFDVTGTLENFAADGSDEQKLTVESNTAWTVLSCPEWLTVTPTKGNKGTCEITLQATANNSLDSRSATLNIGVEGVTSANENITITQEGVVTDLGDRSLDFDWESSQREVEITFPGSWSAMASDDWLTLSQTSGIGEETIVITAATNPGEDARTGTITVASEGRSIKITAIQQGQYLKINSTAGEVGAMGGSVSLTVTTTVGAAATVEYHGTAKDWVTFDTDDKGNYALSVAYNPSSNIRTAQFVIKPTMSGTNTTCSSGVKFAITQKGRSLSANVNSIAISVAGGTSDTYTITADGGYSITKPDADDWYTLQQDSANSTFYIVASENTTGQKRNSQLTVSLTGLPNGEEKSLAIEVVQYDLYNGYEYVDLGLPSGLKWATCNVGATKPEEYGGYYAWGETEEKENYDWSTYKWCKGSESTMTKYCTSTSYGTVDNKTVLDPEDDVAHVKWGGSWRMPTKAEQDELRNNCTWSWTTQNGVNGYKVTSNVNGNSIFLPAAGYRYVTNLNYSDIHGIYWSSSLYDSRSRSASGLLFDEGGYVWRDYNRYYGHSVRPVCGEWRKYTVIVSCAGNGNVAIKDKDGTSAEIETGSTVTVVATPDEGYLFDGWYVDGSEEPVSTDAEYTFTISEDVALVARFEQIVYETVDLGLPSGIKWAAYNVGATKPEEYGGYYAWGETEEKEFCTKENSVTNGKAINDISGNPMYDVACAKWGSQWRMPTKKEYEELLDKCTWIPDYINGVHGYIVEGVNGNSIFMPTAGYQDGGNISYGGLYGYYWSSTPIDNEKSYACVLDFQSSGTFYDWYARELGKTVRPVCGEWLKYTVSVGTAGSGAVAIKDVDGTSATIEVGSTVTVVATPADGYMFSGWYDGDALVSTDAEYTFTVSEDIALVARFEVNEPGSANGDYYVKYGADVMVERSDRYPRSVGIVGAQSPQQQLNDIASASSHAAYFDKTSTVFEVKSGETVTPTISYTGTWMHGYVFVDWDNSKQFEVNLEGDGPFTKGEGNELMCWSFYGKDGEDIGWNSAGSSLRGSDSNSLAPGSFRVPDGLVTGSTYRMRFAIMWNCIDPSGDYERFIDDGGSIIDVTLKIIGDADDETDPSPFDSDKLYTISSQRAFLLYQPSTNALVASTGAAVNAVQNPQDPNQQFQIKRNSSGYQLYSVGAGGYAVYQSMDNVQFDSNAGSKLTITETGNSAYPWKLQLGDYYLNTQDGSWVSTGLKVDTWSDTDAGNSYILEEVGPPVTHIVSVSSEDNGSVAISGSSGTSVAAGEGSSVTVIAMPYAGYAFEGWYTGSSETLVSTNAEYTFTVIEDVALVARFEQIVAVDLGLPSGIKWATFNVGATKPEEYGGYYAWGETEEKENYDWSTYKWCNGSDDTMTKYCIDSSFGTVDNKTVLDLEDDVAHVKWGGDWRMPTKAEQDELRDNCTWTWTTQNGVNGYKVTSKTNGNSIFFPDAGDRYGTHRGSGGNYWSGSLDGSSSHNAYLLFFYSGYYDWKYRNRCHGRSVRPVCK